VQITRTWLVGAVAAVVTAALVVVPAGTAAADDRCPGFNDVEIPRAHANLHGRTVYFCHDRAFVNAYARVFLPRDGANYILSVDRHRKEVTEKEFWSTTEIEAKGGGWDYWEERSKGNENWVETSQHDNYKNAMRVCLRRNGALQCANTWFADQDW
jgi:hypothetical protein